MKKFFKRLLIVLLIAFVVIQFFRPTKNKSDGPFPNDITTKYEVPDSVMVIMKVACYDCHSSNTRYPWYSNFQPVAWWLNNHIQEGKSGLNFNEFASYKLRRQYARFEQTADLVEKEEMPLKSYTWIHKDAILGADKKAVIMNWAHRMMDTMRAHYPPDSLLRKKGP